jgi:TPR repeat protein
MILVLFSGQAFANQCVELMKKEDYYEASPVCEKMAKKGDVVSQYTMGVLYYQGMGVMADMGQSVKWLRKAAEKNHRLAQYNLGIMIANGQGVQADLVEAYAWLSLSAKNGYADAAEALKNLAEELSSSEKKKAEKRIVELKTKYKL